MLSGLRIYGFCFVVGVLLPASAEALTQQQVLWCNSGTNASPDLRIEGCTAVIQSGRALGKNLAAAYINRGIASYDKGDYDSAIADYSQAIRLSPRDANAYNNRGNVYDDKGEYDRAIADYSQAIRFNPRYALAYFGRGVAYFDKGDYDSAIADYNKAIRLDPRYSNAYSNRGVAYYHKGDFGRAMADYKEAIRLNPRDANAYNNSGNIYNDEGDMDGAIADYSEAIRLSPRFATPYNGRGVAYGHKGEYNRAIADYSKAIRLNPRYKNAYFNRGRVNLDIGALPKALADLTQAGALDSKDAYIALWRDIASKRSGLAGQLAAASKQIDMTKWPAPVVRLYLAQLTPAAVVAAADNANPATRKRHVCEAKFFIGEFDLWQGKKDKAARLFRAVVGDCPGGFGEYDDAAAEVKMLRAQP